MSVIKFSSLGMNREVARFWIEGRQVAHGGISYGQTLQVKFDDKNQRVLLSPATDTVNNPLKLVNVSKRTQKGSKDLFHPLLELKDNRLLDLFDEDDTLRVLIRKSKIIITRHIQHSKIEERETAFRAAIESGEELSVASFFHGGGVLDRAMHEGFKRVGINTKVSFASELEGKYLQSSYDNNPMLFNEDSILVEGPLQMVSFSDKCKPVNLFYGGVPCTGASRSGKSKNALEFAESHTSAGTLFYQYLQGIQNMNPAVVLLENVPDYQSTASMTVIRSCLETWGYTLQEAILNGNDFGALENRDRLVMVAVSNGLAVDFDINEIKPLFTKQENIGEILNQKPLEEFSWSEAAGLKKKEKSDIKAGKGFRMQILTEQADKFGTIGKGYQKARSTEPRVQHPTNPDLSRLFEPEEHARGKRIPLDMIKGLSKTVANEVMGQSVIFSLFEALATSLGVSFKKAGLFEVMEVSTEDQDLMVGSVDLTQYIGTSFADDSIVMISKKPLVNDLSLAA